MGKDFYTIPELLAAMDSGQPFTLTYVTADVKRGTGGAIKTERGAIKTGRLPGSKPGRPQTASPAAQIPGKNPNHSTHVTRNIQLRNQEVRTVHIDLITSFNGKKVI